MSEVDVKHIHEDLSTLKQEIALIRNILVEEYELSDWAKQELAEARKVKKSDLINLKDVKKRLLK